MSTINRDPDHAGVGRAWVMEMGPEHRRDQDASIIGYVLNGPWHPLWSWWMVSVVHLRDLPGMTPAKKHYPEAEYEFLIVSIDPQTRPDPDRPFPQNVKYLTPVDVCEQFHGVTDDQAAEICTAAIRAITRGSASPNQDYRSWWKDAIAKTVEHYKAGVH
jgi:hypothetical protein